MTHATEHAGATEHADATARADTAAGVRGAAAAQGGGLQLQHVLRPVRDGLVVAGLLFGAYTFAVIAPIAKTVGFDAYAYWSCSLASPYSVLEGQLGAFPYSPVIARLFAPFSALPWESFLVLWLGVLLGTAIWLGGWRASGNATWRRWGWVYVLAFPPVAIELYHGNVQLLIAAAIALGFRFPAAWAFVLLTKVTPGVGLLWFAVRREWRSLGIALGVTGVVVVVSLAVDGGLWRQWIDAEVLTTLRTAPDQPQLPIPLLIRLPAAAALVTWGALTNRRWTVPAAATIALPVLWFAGLSVLAAIPAATRPEMRSRDEAGAAPSTATVAPVAA